MLLSLLLACQDYTINEKLQGEPIIAPDFIDFGHLRSGQEAGLRQIIFSNGGNAPLHVDYIEIEGERFDVDTSGFTVEPLAWHALDLTYIPETFEFNEGYLDVYLEGQQQPVSSVWFQGWGDAPVLTVNPPSVNYGILSEDCNIEQEISFTNDGNLDLIIEGIQQVASLPQQITVDYGSLPDFPWTIIPQGRIAFWTDFTAEGLSLHSLTLKVASNDPHEPVKDILAEGETMISTTMLETFTQGTAIFVDVVWVIDNSGSMRPFQNALSINMSNFMTSFLAYSPDFQMAFITTDDFGIVNGETLYSGDPDATLKASNIIGSIGTWGGANEKGLEMLELMLQHNPTWFRQGAALVPIFLSDEQDWSTSPWTYYVNRYDSLHDHAPVLPFGIIGDVPGGCYGAQAGFGYWDVIDHYNTSWWSICDGDWGTQMQDLALAIIDSVTYVLDHPTPKEETIAVFVNGQEVVGGWFYNSESNSISFEFDSRPEAGDTVEISYEIWECQ